MMIIWKENSERWLECKDEIYFGCNNDLVTFFNAFNSTLKPWLLPLFLSYSFLSSFVVQCQKRCSICSNEHWFQNNLNALVPCYGNTSFVYIILAMKKFRSAGGSRQCAWPTLFVPRIQYPMIQLTRLIKNASFMKRICMDSRMWNGKIMNFPLSLWWCLLHFIKHALPHFILYHKLDILYQNELNEFIF